MRLSFGDQMSVFISQAFNELTARTSLNHGTIKYCLACALAQAACEFFSIKDCTVDLHKKIVTPTFHVGSDIEIEAAELFSHDPVYHDLIPAEFLFNMFGKDVFNRTLELFKNIIREVAADELEKKWRRKVRNAVEGVIEEKYPDLFEVNLGDNVTGIMRKGEWTPSEVPSYRQGKLFLFYVLKVVREGSTVTVHLSRGVPGLPAAILKTLVPWATVKTIKRIRGRKTWLRIRPPVPASILREVGAKLDGEVVDAASPARSRNLSPAL